MNSEDIDKFYVSPYDKFLFGFDATHKKSASQLQEIKKHQRIAKLRDDKTHQEQKGEIWDSF